MMIWVIVGLTMVSCKSLRRGNASDLTSSVPAVAESVYQGEPTDERSIAADASADRLITDYVQEEVVVSDPSLSAQKVEKEEGNHIVVNGQSDSSDVKVAGRKQQYVSSSFSSPKTAKTVSRKGVTTDSTKKGKGDSEAGSSMSFVEDSAAVSVDEPLTKNVTGSTDESNADSIAGRMNEPLKSEMDSSSACIVPIASDSCSSTSNSCYRYLLGALILLIVLFVLYIIYSRAREKNRLRSMRREIEEYKKLHGAHEAASEVENMVQRRISATTVNLKRERDEALAIADSARAEKEAVLSSVQDSMASENGQVTELQASLAAQEADLTARESRISEQQREMAEKEAAFAAREAEFDRLSQRLTDKEAELTALSAQLDEKEAGLLQKEAGLTQEAAEFAVKRQNLEAKVVEMEAKVRKLEEERAEMEAMASSSAAMNVVAQVEPDRTEETNIMRRMLIAKIEAGQTILGLKGAKKGEVLSSEEWDEIENYLEIADKGFLKRLREQYPGLNRKDIELMMLLRLRIPSRSIASVYGINEKSIKQKLFIYKEKVGLGGDTTSLRELIENL